MPQLHTSPKPCPALFFRCSAVLTRCAAAMVVHAPHSGLTSASLTWDSPIQHVLVLKKHDPEMLHMFLDVLKMLLESKDNLYVNCPHPSLSHFSLPLPST